MPKRGWLERDGKRVVFEIGLLANLISFCLLLMAFVSPYWIVSWPRVYSPFKRIGLWEACFAGLMLEMDPVQKSYHGCWWILAPEFRNIKKWIMPGWFTFTQVAVTFCIVAELVGFIMTFFVWLTTGMTQRDPNVKRKRDPLVLIQTSTIITVSTASVMSFTVTLFGLMFKFDRHWLPMPWINYMSWSYGLAILSSFFSIFGAIAQVVYVNIARQEHREPPPPDSAIPVKNRQQPPTFHGSYSGLKMTGSKEDLSGYSNA